MSVYIDRYLHRHWVVRASAGHVLLGVLVLLSLLALSTSAGNGNGSRKIMDLRKGKICIGTTGRMSVPSTREHHYRNLRDRYTNCTYVDGNLELTWIQDENFNLSFLQHIREVTGYVLISHVDIKRVVLPNLQIIRGRTLFKLNIHDEELALLVTLSKMSTLELPALRDILAGSVALIDNFNLCHVKRIKWDEIITGTSAKYIYVYNFSEPERKCSCDKSCESGCWGDGPENCQKFSRVNCAAQCHQGRCFGPHPRDCCHLFCAGGCTGPKQSDCLACKNFYDNGVCKQECPQMQKYNPITYSWENNPEGKYAYGATCVKDCPEHLLKDSGACVRSCPAMKKAMNGECVPCDGPCPKTCMGVDTVHSGNIESFRDCTIIEGWLRILDTSFLGFQEVFQNSSFGQRYVPMSPDSLEVFSTLKEVTGFIDIQAAHENFTNLNYFRNLETIGGRQLTEYFSALYIVKTDLKSLGLQKLKLIRSGSVAILENANLCFADNINWTKLMRSADQNVLLQNNRPKNECMAANLVCHKECTLEGCWGPKDSDCLSCAHYELDDVCLGSCTLPKIFYASNKLCDYCHEECLDSCNGTGPGNCTKCKNVQDGPYCVAQCPSMKFVKDGVCMPCDETCTKSCSGEGKYIGEGGCESCEKAILTSTDMPIKGTCLKADDPCPEGHFSEWVGIAEQGSMQALSGKSICRKCHPRCKNCSGYGFHTSVCYECKDYRAREQCEDRCPPEHYADEELKECLKCSNECRECFGPGINQCRSCRNFRVPIENNFTNFNCAAVCPHDRPFKVLPEEAGDPYCSDVDPTLMSSSILDDGGIGAIVGGVLGCVALVGIFLAVFAYNWRQRAKSKENTIKMTMRMSGLEDSEPLKPSNVKPNLAQLRIVKEAELRRGGILGYGAFGVVYKGVWVPENENIKIPVAIKVLREGTGTNTNKEILEEAYIMASVEHPNLLKLLAVCMTSQMMLVTQLMPLGCLLDYVRNNKDKIGSKPLLNWCTQIAKGMAHLEEKRLVHRDLAARNVLVQTPGCVKITDFGLAKLLDINEEEYKAAGGKMPIKWLALECIQHRRFTHKSDVWAFGVTVWELLTYGGRPYDNVPARQVPDLLEKGERLPQPSICTIDVYMIMIKCWMLDAESRPSFKELSDEFAKMARDPGRYLVIQGDKLMRLPTYSPQDEKELLRNLSMTTDGPEVFMDAEEYLQPKPNGMLSTSDPDSLTLPPPTPTKKYSGNHLPPPYSAGPDLMDPMSQQQYPLHGGSHQGNGIRPDRKYAHLEAAVLANSTHSRPQDPSLNSRYSRDPLKLLGKGKDPEIDMDSPMNGCINPGGYHKRDINKVGNLNLEHLPVDEEDYLMPSPQPHNQTSSMYMDLIGDNRVADSMEGRSKDNLWHAPVFVPMNNNLVGLDNPEYHIVVPELNGQMGPPPPPPPLTTANAIAIATANGQPAILRNGVIPKRRKNTSSEEDSDHEYYNDFDGLSRELQPLNHRRSETTV